MGVPSRDMYLGIDFGTSAVRLVVIDAEKQVVAQSSEALPDAIQEGQAILQDPEVWWQALERAFMSLAGHCRLDGIKALSVDGTSGTLLLADSSGTPLTVARLYNDAACRQEAERIAAVASPDSGAQGATSALARLLNLRTQCSAPYRALHQADWIAGRLTGRATFSDENNALKLGYDPIARKWPSWLRELDVDEATLPQVLEPGSFMGLVRAEIAEFLGLSNQTKVMAGTTDGCAAFLATEASEIGDAVTSLGTTLVVKLLSDKPLFDRHYGVYSHRLGEKWLVGGASNSGGAALRHYFDETEMASLEALLTPETPTGLDYYPLPRRGERFPVNDPEKESGITDPPRNRAVFYQALLEGIAAVEALAYRRLTELGAPEVRSIRTVGRGAQVSAWREIRQRRLPAPLHDASSEDAAYGSALIAMRAAAEKAS